jgi:hypothetical protein
MNFNQHDGLIIKRSLYIFCLKSRVKLDNIIKTKYIIIQNKLKENSLFRIRYSYKGIQ